jgi:membrane protein
MQPTENDRSAVRTKDSHLWTLLLAGALLAIVLLPRLPLARRNVSAPEDAVDSREPTLAELEVSKQRAREPNRGRGANTPSEIPARGWKDIVWRTWEGFNQDRVLSVAAALSR